MPNAGLREQFLVFATKNSLFGSNKADQTAYVLPAFEIKKGLKFSKNKNELLYGVSLVPPKQLCSRPTVHKHST